MLAAGGTRLHAQQGAASAQLSTTMAIAATAAATARRFTGLRIHSTLHGEFASNVSCAMTGKSAIELNRIARPSTLSWWFLLLLSSILSKSVIHLFAGQTNQ